MAGSAGDRWRGPAQVGIVLGVVWTIMGFVYGKPGIWIPGLIVLAIGGYAKTRTKTEG